MFGHAWPRFVAALALTFGVATVMSPPAWAANEGSIDHAQSDDGLLRVLYSVPELAEGVGPDFDSLEVTLNGVAVEAEAEAAAHAGATVKVRRTTILAIDTSNSMRGDRFEQAKAAAKAFLASTPEDVYVGIVTFAGRVEVVQPPTLNRDTATAVIDELDLSVGTRLYDGVIAAVQAADTEGQRSLLVLSDGRDTSQTELEEVVQAIRRSEVRVDVVALEGAAQANEPLEAMASEGKGAVIAAEDPQALTTLFSDEAAALARQVLISAELPPEVTGTEGSLSVSVRAGGRTYRDTAFISFGKSRSGKNEPVPPSAPTAPSALSTPVTLWAGLVALGIGLLVVLLGAIGLIGKSDGESVEDKIAVYTAQGMKKSRAAARANAGQSGDHSKSVTGSALSITEKALAGNKGIEAKLADKLEGAALSLKPAEWLLLHAGIAIGSSILGYLLASGNALFAVVCLLAGGLLPWIFLGIKKSRRLKAFNAQLAETLQLISGSLSAGLSLAQSLDTVVREGNDPIAAEFKRALIEARLGVAVEDSLESIAQRMESADFEWVVMAIRIQREVGGNLSELLLKVAATMRERDYLRRQVKTLSAEGRMSAWILGGLPPGMLVYMLMTNPKYLSPLISEPIGWLMLGTMVVLMAVGAFWMSRVVKVEV